VVPRRRLFSRGRESFCSSLESLWNLFGFFLLFFPRFFRSCFPQLLLLLVVLLGILLPLDQLLSISLLTGGCPWTVLPAYRFLISSGILFEAESRFLPLRCSCRSASRFFGLEEVAQRGFVLSSAAPRLDGSSCTSRGGSCYRRLWDHFEDFSSNLTFSACVPRQSSSDAGDFACGPLDMVRRW